MDRGSACLSSTHLDGSRVVWRTPPLPPSPDTRTKTGSYLRPVPQRVPRSAKPLLLAFFASLLSAGTIGVDFAAIGARRVRVILTRTGMEGAVRSLSLPPAAKNPRNIRSSDTRGEADS